MLHQRKKGYKSPGGGFTPRFSYPSYSWDIDAYFILIFWQLPIPTCGIRVRTIQAHFKPTLWNYCPEKLLCFTFPPEVHKLVHLPAPWQRWVLSLLFFKFTQWTQSGGRHLIRASGKLLNDKAHPWQPSANTLNDENRKLFLQDGEQDKDVHSRQCYRHSTEVLARSVGQEKEKASKLGRQK